ARRPNAQNGKRQRNEADEHIAARKRRRVAERNSKPKNARRPRSFAAARRKRTASWPHAPPRRHARRPNAENERQPATGSDAEGDAAAKRPSDPSAGGLPPTSSSGSASTA